MTTNFTLRDFFVFLMTGLILVLNIVIIFNEVLFKFTIDFFKEYNFIKEFSFLVSIFLIPLIYLIGHIIGSISYNLLKIYVWINKKFERPIPKCQYCILMMLQIVLYRQRVVYAIIQYTKANADKKIFKDTEEFWILCAKLQIKKIYSSAEYWSFLNEFFNSINIIFFISMFISFVSGHWIYGIIYCLLSIFAFKRARQYSDLFIKTVCRLTIADQEVRSDIIEIKPK